MIENPEEIYSAVVYDGCCVESKGVSLCNLEDFMNTTVGIPRS